MIASADARCDWCGHETATVGLSDEVSSPPRYLRLCERCLTAEKGAFFLSALRETGSVPPELDSDDEESLLALGEAWDHLFLDNMTAKALAEAEAEDDPQTLQFIATKLEEDAAQFERKLTRAQQAFVRRHRAQAI